MGSLHWWDLPVHLGLPSSCPSHPVCTCGPCLAPVWSWWVPSTWLFGQLPICWSPGSFLPQSGLHGPPLVWVDSMPLGDEGSDAVGKPLPQLELSCCLGVHWLAAPPAHADFREGAVGVPSFLLPSVCVGMALFVLGPLGSQTNPQPRFRLWGPGAVTCRLATWSPVVQ